MTREDLVRVAETYYNSGLTVLPADKATKRPVIAWKEFTESKTSFDKAFGNVNRPFNAICVVCGPVSNGVEIIDFDQQAKAFDAFRNEIEQEPLLKGVEFVTESTQSKGLHLAFKSDFCGRNQKLALDKNNNVLIETRGSGGICLIAPSDGYENLEGNWTCVPIISKEQREKLLEIARRFDEQETKQVVTQATTTGSENGLSIADYLRTTDEARNALVRAGWKPLFKSSTFEHFERPDQRQAGKVGGSLSVTDKYFHCFTSNAYPLEIEKNYSPLQLIATLEFNGDLSAASKAYKAKQPRTYKPIEIVSLDEFETYKERKEEQENKQVVFPQELLSCGGLIQELQDVANAYAIREQPEGAFIAALASMSYLCGRSIVCANHGNLVTPNIYALFLAPSGMGKENCRALCREVARIYEPFETCAESFASVQALQNTMIRRKKIIWLHDEFGRDLSVMNNQRSNTNLQSIITETLKLYSNASNRAYLPKVIAQEAKGVKQIEPVDRPSLTLFATGNQTEYFNATSEEVLKNGYIARFTTVLGREYTPIKEISFEEARNAPVYGFSADLKRRLDAWKAFSLAAEEDPFLVSFNREAYDVLNGFVKDVDERFKSGNESDGVRELNARLVEKAWKYALLFTASRYGTREDLEIDKDCASFGVALARYEANVFDANAQRFANCEEARAIESVLGWIKSINQPFTKSQFTRKFQHKFTAKERTDILITLVEAETIAKDEKTNTYIYLG